MNAYLTPEMVERTARHLTKEQFCHYQSQLADIRVRSLVAPNGDSLRSACGAGRFSKIGDTITFRRPITRVGK